MGWKDIRSRLIRLVLCMGILVAAGGFSRVDADSSANEPDDVLASSMLGFDDLSRSDESPPAAAGIPSARRRELAELASAVSARIEKRLRVGEEQLRALRMAREWLSDYSSRAMVAPGGKVEDASPVERFVESNALDDEFDALFDAVMEEKTGRGNAEAAYLLSRRCELILSDLVVYNGLLTLSGRERGSFLEGVRKRLLEELSGLRRRLGALEQR